MRNMIPENRSDIFLLASLYTATTVISILVIRYFMNNPMNWLEIIISIVAIFLVNLAFDTYYYRNVLKKN